MTDTGSDIDTGFISKFVIDCIFFLPTHEYYIFHWIKYILDNKTKSEVKVHYIYLPVMFSRTSKVKTYRSRTFFVQIYYINTTYITFSVQSTTPPRTFEIWNSLYKKYSTFERSVSFLLHSVSYVQPKYWSSKSTGGCSRLLDGSVHSFATLFSLFSWSRKARGVLFLEKTITCNIVRVLLGPLPSPSLVAAVFADDEKSGERRSKAERGREKGGESFRKGVALTYKRVCLAFLFLRSRTMKDELGVHKGGCIARMDFSPPPSFPLFPPPPRRETRWLSVSLRGILGIYEIEGCAFQFNARDSPCASRYVSNRGTAGYGRYWYSKWSENNSFPRLQDSRFARVNVIFLC